MQRVIVLAITCLLGLVGRTADAHVAPSIDDNNRYLKLTPTGDRVRVAYTVFFGENPGRQMRPGLDADKDGVLSEAEGARFGAKLSREVADGLELTVDGTTRAVRWATVAVGLGTPDIAAGSFSVDMIAYVCLPRGGRHTLLLRDRFRVPRPGETEVKVEDSVGVTIEHARVGPFDDPGHDYKLVGPGGPLMDDGLDLAFTISSTAPQQDGACSSGVPATPEAGSRTMLLIGGGIGLVVLVLAGLAIVRRRKRAR